KFEEVNGKFEEVNSKVDNLEKEVDSKFDDLKDDVQNQLTGMSTASVHYDTDEEGNKTGKITLQGVSKSRDNGVDSTLNGDNESEPVVIDNLADGKIAEDSKEAVNGGQLYKTREELMQYTDNKIDETMNHFLNESMDEVVKKTEQYVDEKFSALSYDIKAVQNEARQAAAVGLAVSNLRYNDTPGKLSIAFGSGFWRSQSALAFGAGYTSENGNIRSNLSVTSSGGHFGIGAGISITLN
ncbi:YadA-like family protein, partial [Bartonella sp. F02]|uniref:YadA-like family protein n=1 Tax=Bartonella sp. F02 TaxID=2967262 RepID=UPI0022A9C3F7